MLKYEKKNIIYFRYLKKKKTTKLSKLCNYNKK